MPQLSEFVASWVAPGLAAIFAFALGTKLRDWPHLVDWLQHLNVPHARRAAVGALGSEALLVALLVTVPLVGLAGAIVWLSGATVLLLRAKRLNAPCACFGRSAGSPSLAILRNTLLVGLAVVALSQANEPNLPVEVRATAALAGPAALLVASLRNP